MRALITGGAGFIGSNLAAELLCRGHAVVCVDNFTLGRRENLEAQSANPMFALKEMDVSDVEQFSSLVGKEQPDIIFHLAANSDIQKSVRMPGIDFKDTFSTTYAVLEAMRRNSVTRLFFSSTSAVYGDKPGVNLTEGQGGLAPISYYGGAKLASEAFISSYAYMNGFDVTVFRFPNVIGPGLTHGVIYDFVEKLKRNSNELQILGDGTQAKPYLFVKDLVEAILFVTMSGEKGVNLYNVGVEGKTSVTAIADMVCRKMGLSNVSYQYTGGKVGWKGDVPSFQYDLTKIHKRGWAARHSSDESVQATLECFLP